VDGALRVTVNYNGQGSPQAIVSYYTGNGPRLTQVAQAKKRLGVDRCRQFTNDSFYRVTLYASAVYML